MVASLIAFYLRSTPALLIAFFLSLLFLIIPTLWLSIEYFITHSTILFYEFLVFILVGLSFSLLASLCAWPFALTFSTLILHKKSFPIFKFIETIVHFLSGIPLLIFSYTIIEVFGKSTLFGLNDISIDILATSNLITQTIAFSLTIILYPLTIIPGFYENQSVDLFFHEMLNSVIRFAELGSISFIIVFALFLYILPKMIVKMFYYLKKDQNIKNYEVIQSLGGTPWESLYITSLHAMKANFNLFVVQFTKICFFEGLIGFSLINFYLINYKNSWNKTASSFFIEQSLESFNVEKLAAIGGFLFMIYFLFIGLESYFFKRKKQSV